MAGIITLDGNTENAVSAPINKKFIYLTTLVAALGGLLFGFDTAIISGTIPFIKTYFNVNDVMLGWLVSSLLAGCGVGAWIAGKLSDQYGRRKVLHACAITFAVSGVAAGLAGSIPVFVLWRFIGGLAVGVAAMVSPMYIAEISPAGIRGRLVSLYQLAIVLGILLAFTSNYFLADVMHNWRWMFASQAVPAMLFFFALFTVPESPRWLIMHGESEKAQVILSRVGGIAYGENQRVLITQNIHNKPTQSTASLKPYYRLLSVGVCIAVFSQITGINTVLYYAPIIFDRTGASVESSLFQTLVIGITNVMATVVAFGIIDKIGRRPLLLAGAVMMGLFLFALAWLFMTKTSHTEFILMAVVGYIATFGITLGPVTWVYLSEMFPNLIRARALSWATASLWAANFLVTLVFPSMLTRLGEGGTMLIIGCICLVYAIFILTFVAETKGKTLEEITGK